MAAGTELNAKYTFIGGPRETGSRRFNYVPNPAFQTNTTNYAQLAATGSFTRVLITDSPGGGGYVLRQVNPGTNSAEGVIHALIPGLVASQSYTFSFWIRTTSGTMAIRSSLAERTVADVAVGQTNNDFTATTTWQRISVTRTFGATGVGARLLVHANGTIAGTYEVKGLKLEQNTSATIYFDGDSPGYYWTGTAHASASGQDGTRAVLNDETDPDYIGVVTNVTGLDSAEVIESVEENIDSDGASHGTFFSGRRPVIFESLIYKHTTIADRNQKQQRLSNAVNALRSDGVVRWTPSGYEEMYIDFRKQQPTRVSGNWNKGMQNSIVAADPRIFAVDPENSSSLALSGSGTAGRSYDRSYDLNFDWAPARGSVSVTNSGDGFASPRITLAGTIVNPAIQNTTTERELALNISLGPSDVLVIDFNLKLIILNGNDSVYSALQTTRSWWWDLIPGANTIQILATSFSSATMLVEWRHTWI